MEPETIGPGDEVFHAPSGETWVVACVIGDRLSWAGWPEGHALLGDCRLVTKATEQQRYEILRAFANSPSSTDHRVQYARRALGIDA